jgi:hypothetical protein
MEETSESLLALADTGSDVLRDESNCNGGSAAKTGMEIKSARMAPLPPNRENRRNCVHIRVL